MLFLQLTDYWYNCQTQTQWYLLLWQHSVHNKLNVSAKKGEHQALYKTTNGSKVCYPYVCAFIVRSQLYTNNLQFLMAFKLLSVLVKYFFILLVNCVFKLRGLKMT